MRALTGIALFVSFLFAGCGGNQDPYDRVPSDIPREAAPVWLLSEAIARSDTNLMKLIWSEAGRENSESYFKKSLLEGILERNKRDIADEVSRYSGPFSVVKSEPGLFRHCGVADSSLYNENFALVELGSGNGVYVIREDGVWKLFFPPQGEMKNIIHDVIVVNEDKSSN